MIRDTFELNPGLAELFKKKIREIAREVQFPEDLIDFESHIDMQGTYPDNLRIFYSEYPRLGERSDYLSKNPIRRPSNAQIERAYQFYQIDNGETPEPMPIIAVANTGETSTEPMNSEPAMPSLPILSFNFNYQIVTETPETVPDISRKPKPEPTTPEPTLAESPVSRVKDHVNKCTHFLIIGDKDQGKSALGYSILEEHHENTARPCFVYRPPKPELLPDWIISIENLDDLPQGAVCLIDEASKDFDQYSYRNSWNRHLAEKLQIARHKDQSIILVYQTTKRANSNLLYPIDVYLLKKPTMFQLLEERALILNAYKRIQRAIQVNEYYWLDGDRLEKGTFTKPPWYTEELSKAYADYTPETGHSAAEKFPATYCNQCGKSVPRRDSRTYMNLTLCPQCYAVNVAEPRFQNSKILHVLSALPGKLFTGPQKTQAPKTQSSGPLDPAGVLLAAIVGTVGLYSLLRGAIPLAAVCLTLAFLGLIYSHPRFDGEKK